MHTQEAGSDQLTIERLRRARSAAVPSDRLCSLRTPVMLERHPAVYDIVLLPLRRALGEGQLRLDDFLEQRICGGVFFDYAVVEFELFFENGIRRLVEL